MENFKYRQIHTQVKHLLHTLILKMPNTNEERIFMNYGHNFGCGDPCYTTGYSYPVAGAYYPSTGGFQGFALIVVLFILLIIIGASCYGKY
jgi:uncharacterized protein (TIGR01732 family)